MKKDKRQYFLFILYGLLNKKKQSVQQIAVWIPIK